MDQDSCREDRQGSRSERAAVPFRPGRDHPMLRAPQGRTLTTEGLRLPVLARPGRADHRWICPFVGVKRSWEYAQMAATFRKGLGETGLLIVVLALVKPLSPPGDLSGQLICGPIEA